MSRGSTGNGGLRRFIRLTFKTDSIARLRHLPRPDERGFAVTRIRRYGIAILSPTLIAAFVLGIMWATSTRSTVFFFGGPPELFAISPSPIMSFHAKAGQAVTVEYRLKNISNQPVRIVGANSSCGCTMVTNSFPLECGPGDSVKILVQMKVGQPARDGEFVQKVDLLVNRPGAVPTLILQAHISPS